ncbi:thioredoxin [Rickettsiales bacterium]|nr:thioredoxin [Rickettsiales bacterium]
MAVVEVKDSAHFEQITQDERDKLLLIDFFADWCAPCKEFAKVILELEEIEEISSNVLILKCDIADCAEIATKYNVQSVPTLLLIRNNMVVDRRIGALNKQAAHSWISNNMTQD